MGTGNPGSGMVVLAAATATRPAPATSAEIKPATSASRVFQDLCLGVLRQTALREPCLGGSGIGLC